MTERGEIRTWYPLASLPEFCDAPEKHPLAVVDFQPGNDNTTIQRKVRGKGQAYYYARCRACHRETCAQRRYEARGGPPRQRRTQAAYDVQLRPSSALAAVADLLPKVRDFLRVYPDTPWVEISHALAVPYSSLYRWLRAQGITPSPPGGGMRYLHPGAEVALSRLAGLVEGRKR